MSGTEGHAQVTRHIARGGSANLVGSVLSAVLGFALTLVVAHGFDTTQAGAFFAVTSLFLILVAVAEFGADTSLPRFIPALRQRGQVAGIRIVIHLSTWVSIVLGILLAVAVGLWREEFARLVGQSPRASDLAILLLLISVAVPLSAVGNNLLAATRGLFTIRPTVWIDRIGRPALQLTGVAVAAIVHSAGLAMSSWLLAMAFALLPAWWLLRRLMADFPRISKPGNTRPLRGEYLRYTWPRAIARTLAMLLQRLDVIAVAAILSPSEAAIYAVATRFIVLAQLTGSSLQQVIAPRISHLLEADDTQTAMAVARTSAGWTMLTAWPICLSSLSMGGIFLQIMGGADYLPGAGSLAILAVGLMVGSAAGPVDTVLLMAGRSGISLFNMALAVGVNVSLLFWWTPLFGIDGAAAAWATAIALRSGLGILFVRRMTGQTAFGSPGLAAAAASIVAFGLVPWALGLGERSIPVALAGLLAATCVYAAFLWVLRKPLSLEAFTSVLRRRGGPV